MDALIDSLIQIVWRNFLRVLIMGLFYWPGWLILRTLTWNRYPPNEARHNKDFVAVSV